MADNKKSFLLYCDLIHTIEKMPPEKAGELFLHILRYVNDMNPETEDLLTKIAFEPIKQNLKRDLVKWSLFINKQSINGAKGGRPTTPNNPKKGLGYLDNPNKPKKAVNVNVSVNDSVNDIQIKKTLVYVPNFDLIDLPRRQTFKEWHKYKVDSGFRYTELGWQKLVTMMQNEYAKDEDFIKNADKSMAEGWKGIGSRFKQANQTTTDLPLISKSKY